MLGSIFSVIAGYLVMAIIVMLGAVATAAVMVPGGLAAMKNNQAAPTVSQSYLIVNLVLSVVAAVVGGWLTARLAPSSPLVHAAVLAAIVLVMAIVTARSQAGKTTNQPSWYPVTLAAIGVVGVMIGGFLRSSAG